MPFSLVVPLWNEEKNVVELVKMLERSGLPAKGMSEVVLVNNGSQDQTGPLIEKLASEFSWVKPVHLAENLNYGGGVYEGFQHCRSEVLAYIPGDLQVSGDDLAKVWGTYQRQNTKLVCKGHRTVRKDGWNTRLVSKIYTLLANVFLGLRIKDVNGLPKMFHRELLTYLPQEKMKTFVFDAQLLYTARRKKWDIREVPVTFHARRVGVSSWSRKRLSVYWTTIKQMFRLRGLYN